jgi:hypothetical protein
MLTMMQKKAAIDRIAAANGDGPLPEAVVREARNPKHPLHECFDWNDEKAAHEHRLDQARALISSIQVLVEYEDILVPTTCYVHDVRKGRQGQGYCSVDALSRRRQDAIQTLELELERIIGVVERTRGIAGSLGLGSLFEGMLQSAITAKLRVQKKGRKAA